jgi:hypothetical protein
MELKMKIKIIGLSLFFAIGLKAQIVVSLLSVTNPAGAATGDTITVNGNTRYFTNVITAFNQIPTGTDVWTTVSNIILYYRLLPETNINLYSSISSGQIKFSSVPGNTISVSGSADWASVVTETNFYLGTFYVRVPYENVANPVEKSNVESGLVGYLNDTNSPATIKPNAPIFSLLTQNAAGRATNLSSPGGLPSAGNLMGITYQTNYLFLPAHCMTNDGDTCTRTLGLQLQPGPDWKRLQVFWNSNNILDTGMITNLSGPSSLSAVCQVTRNSMTNASFTCYALENELTNAPGYPQNKVFTSTGLLPFPVTTTYASPIPCYLILTDGGSAATNNQITVWMDRTKVENAFGLY